MNPKKLFERTRAHVHTKIIDASTATDTGINEKEKSKRVPEAAVQR